MSDNGKFGNEDKVMGMGGYLYLLYNMPNANQQPQNIFINFI